MPNFPLVVNLAYPHVSSLILEVTDENGRTSVGELTHNHKVASHRAAEAQDFMEENEEICKP
jgi:hypothetical protein